MTFRLPRLPRDVPLVDKMGQPVLQFQRWWQSVVERVEGAISTIEGNTADIEAATGDLSSLSVSLASLDARIDAYDALAPFVSQDVGPAWTDATGTAARTALASYAGQTVSNPPTQAEMQALDNEVKAQSQALVALINDLKANGAIT